MPIEQLLPEHCDDAGAADCAIAAFQQFSNCVCGIDLGMAEMAALMAALVQRDNTLNSALTVCDATLFPNVTVYRCYINISLHTSRDRTFRMPETS